MKKALGILLLSGWVLTSGAWSSKPLVHLPQSSKEKVVWLDELDLTHYRQGWTVPNKKVSSNGFPIKLGGRTYDRGVGSHSYAIFRVKLDKGCDRFESWVGVDDEIQGHGSVNFEIWADGKRVAHSPVLDSNSEPYLIKADLSGVQEIFLIIEDGGDGQHYDHADWADARFILKSATSPKPMGLPVETLPVPNIHRKTPVTPEIHGASVTGATPGRDFLYRIPVTGKRPMKYSIKYLPAGLSLNPATGIVTGKLQSAGTTRMEILVENAFGKDQKSLTVISAPDSLALTPPLGWNSWNAWGMSVNDGKIRAAAEGMVKTGLADYGYQYINIDDGWEGDRTPEGEITTNKNFPDMKSLGDYIHSKGLKLGIYSSPGPRTCGDMLGSYGHEYQDASTYARWGVDYLKHDWCSYREIAPDPTLEDMKKPYRLMHNALESTNRDIMFSLCQYGMGSVWKWGPEVGGNLWRTTDDIEDSWANVRKIALQQTELFPYAGPGHWNDPDMLVVGTLGWGPSLHPSRLTPHEQITHITLWTILASPMLLGCDLSQVDDFTLDLLTHEEVLAIHQDYPGKQGRLIKTDGNIQIWVKPLSSGQLAVGLVNMGHFTQTASVSWKDLGVSGPQSVRNIWERKNIGTFSTSYQVPVASHGTVFLLISPTRVKVR